MKYEFTTGLSNHMKGIFIIRRHTLSKLTASEEDLSQTKGLDL